MPMDFGGLQHLWDEHGREHRAHGHTVEVDLDTEWSPDSAPEGRR
jgi:hypothetical protein